MACCDYRFTDANRNLVMVSQDDSGAWTQTNVSTGGAITPPLTPLDGGTVGGCPVCITVANNGDGTFTVTQDPGGSFVIDTTGGTVTATDLCAILGTYPAAGVLPGTVQVLGNDCRWYSLPAGSTDSFVTWQANQDGTATLLSADGLSSLPVCTGPCDLCDQIAALADVGTFPAGAKAVIQMVDGTCGVATLPAGSADSFVTWVDNGDGTATFTGADGVTTLGVCLTPCGGGGCTEAATSNGQVFTGEPSGAFVDGCGIIDLAQADPNDAYPPTDFPEGWRQMFSNGATGSEYYVTMLAADGTMQWHAR